jgi:hypothetical protein
MGDAQVIGGSRVTNFILLVHIGRRSTGFPSCTFVTFVVEAFRTGSSVKNNGVPSRHAVLAFTS